MKLKQLIISFLAIAGTLGAVSCNSTESIGNDSKLCVDIVTLESTGDAGSVLSLQVNDDSPVITLLTQQKFNYDDFKVGSRIVMSYIPESNQQYVSGNINVFTAAPTIGAGAAPKVATAGETDNWRSNPVGVVDCRRTGKYLNIIFNATTSGDMRLCELYLDKSSADMRMPNYHFVFNGQPGAMSNTYTFYASYDISEVWNSDIDGIKITFPENSITGEKNVNIIKSSSSITPAE